MLLNKKDILRHKPLIAYIENFMTSSDCDKFIDYAKPLLKKSLIVEKGKEILDPARSSSDVWIPSKQFKTNEILKKTVSEFFDVSQNTFVSTIVINYKLGQEYRAHYDYDLKSNKKKSNCNMLLKQCC